MQSLFFLFCFRFGVFLVFVMHVESLMSALEILGVPGGLGDFPVFFCLHHVLCMGINKCPF